MGMQRYIRGVIAGQDVDKKSALLKIASEEEIDIGSIVMVGDSVNSDIGPAKEAGAVAIGFVKDEAAAKVMRSSEADGIIEANYLAGEDVIALMEEKVRNNKEKQWARAFIDSILIRAYEAKKKNENTLDSLSTI